MYSKEMLTALDGSITKWEKIRRGEMTDKGTINCPLCQLTESSCEACIVKIETGNSACVGIGYRKFCDHVRIVHLLPTGLEEKRVYCHECIVLASNVLHSLRSLKKKVAKKHYLAILNPETAIGEGDIQIVVRGENDEEMKTGRFIATLQKSGRLRLHSGLNPNVGLALNDGNGIMLLFQ